MGEFGEHRSLIRERHPTEIGREVEADHSATADFLARAEQPLLFHVVKGRVEGPGTDLVAMTAEFVGHPRPVQFRRGGVVEDVEPNSTAEKLSHRRNRIVGGRQQSANSRDRGRRPARVLDASTAP